MYETNIVCLWMKLYIVMATLDIRGYCSDIEACQSLLHQLMSMHCFCFLITPRQNKKRLSLHFRWRATSSVEREWVTQAQHIIQTSYRALVFTLLTQHKTREKHNVVHLETNQWSCLVFTEGQGEYVRGQILVSFRPGASLSFTWTGEQRLLFPMASLN